MAVLLPLLLAAAAAPTKTGHGVWPKPDSAEAGSSDDPITFSECRFVVVKDSDGLLKKAAARYEAIIAADHGIVLGADRSAAAYSVTIKVEDVDVPLSPGADMDESYSIETHAAGSTLAAPSVWGALRGLETFSQLVKRSKDGDGLELPPISISDKPRFGWVGAFPTSPHPKASSSPRPPAAACSAG